MSPLNLLAAGLFLAIVFFAYVIGSVSFAVVISRLMGLADPRSYGSKNPGATNVLRSGSKIAALAVLILDGAKGVFAMWLTALFTVGQSLVFLSSEELIALVGFAAFIGHLYPLFHGFKGGKGVATLLGVLLFLHWPTGLTMGVVWLLTAKFSGYSSLAALIGSAVAALVFIVFVHPDLQGLIVFAMVVILWLRHRGNLQRLLRKEEGKIKR